MARRIWLIAVGVLLAIACSGDCALIELELSGTVTRIAQSGGRYGHNVIEGYVDIGDSISGILKFDTFAPDVEPEGFAGQYEYSVGPSGIYLSTGENVFMTNPQSVDFEISVNNDGPIVEPHDYFGAASWDNLPFLDGYVSIDKIAYVAYADYTHLTSDALPTSKNELLGWDGILVKVYGTGMGGEDFYFEGEITSVSIIPEPATIGLLTIGGFMVLMRRKS